MNNPIKLTLNAGHTLVITTPSETIHVAVDKAGESSVVRVPLKREQPSPYIGKYQQQVDRVVRSKQDQPIPLRITYDKSGNTKHEDQPLYAVIYAFTDTIEPDSTKVTIPVSGDITIVIHDDDFGGASMHACDGADLLLSSCPDFEFSDVLKIFETVGAYVAETERPLSNRPITIQTSEPTNEYRDIENVVVKLKVFNFEISISNVTGKPLLTVFDKEGAAIFESRTATFENLREAVNFIFDTQKIVVTVDEEDYIEMVKVDASTEGDKQFKVSKYSEAFSLEDVEVSKDVYYYGYTDLINAVLSLEDHVYIAE